mmetsp:Transcript_57643/g.124639  ORF Transcript_57643/g.124639 Transcript_57643/m.124639 type:complete len:230 (+) Transcript_57643:1552-2241(+)
MRANPDTGARVDPNVSGPKEHARHIGDRGRGFRTDTKHLQGYQDDVGHNEEETEYVPKQPDARSGMKYTFAHELRHRAVLTFDRPSVCRAPEAGLLGPPSGKISCQSPARRQVTGIRVVVKALPRFAQRPVVPGGPANSNGIADWPNTLLHQRQRSVLYLLRFQSNVLLMHRLSRNRCKPSIGRLHEPRCELQLEVRVLESQQIAGFKQLGPLLPILLADRVDYSQKPV